MNTSILPYLSECHIWHDCNARSGDTNMAIDQILLEQISDTPLLRFYDWKTPTISFGYFESLSLAKSCFSGADLNYIRRLTGGGIVDHRADLTYTLIIPSNHSWASLRGSENYRIIHQIVADAMESTGVSCKLIECTHSHLADNKVCFINPVQHDIINLAGEKLAGAGQKRSRQGLLHQGSVIVQNKAEWQDALVKQLTRSPISWAPEATFFEQVNKLAKQRYLSPEWMNKRP